MKFIFLTLLVKFDFIFAQQGCLKYSQFVLAKRKNEWSALLIGFRMIDIDDVTNNLNFCNSILATYFHDRKTLMIETDCKENDFCEAACVSYCSDLYEQKGIDVNIKWKIIEFEKENYLISKYWNASSLFGITINLNFNETTNKTMFKLSKVKSLFLPTKIIVTKNEYFL